MRFYECVCLYAERGGAERTDADKVFFYVYVNVVCALVYVFILSQMDGRLFGLVWHDSFMYFQLLFLFCRFDPLSI